MGRIMSVFENMQSEQPRPRRLRTPSLTLHKVVAVGGGLVCLGTLLSQRKGFLERAAYDWPELIVKRVNNTYFYYGCSLAVASITAFCCYRTSTVMEYLTSCTDSVQIKVFVITNTAIVMSGYVVKSAVYTEGFGTKHSAMLLYAATIGVLTAPMFLNGGQTMVEAAWMTAVINTELTMAALLIPSSLALRMSAPLMVGYIVVDIAHVVGVLCEPRTPMGDYGRKIDLYGGMLVYSGVTLYMSHLTLVLGGTLVDMKGFDPISICFFMFRATINTFRRVSDLLTTEEYSPRSRPPSRRNSQR